jgi:hypothetical protein
MTYRLTSQLVSAADMARERGIDPKRFRAALRAECLPWHDHQTSWTVCRDSKEHDDLKRVLAHLTPGGMTSKHQVPKTPLPACTAGSRSSSDEAWIIDLCDEALGQRALRQHRFPFLVGDPGRSGRRTCLPVDAFYPELKLVIEYHERQHAEQVAFFDRRMTISGISRGEQRRKYDELRRTLLPANGYRLEIFSFSEFAHDRSRRLLRTLQDATVVRTRIRSYL